MEVDDLRFSLSAEKYLERHNVLVFIQDAISQLLEHREENPKVNSSKFFSDYFNSVREGNHVLFREYAYVKATRHNRASFVRMFWKCFKHIGRKGDLLSIKEYHALVGLLCPDFPFTPIQKTARIILMDDALDCLISFSDFLYAFQIQFCFDEFMTKCAEAYQVQVEAPPQSPHTTVVVPTSENAGATSELHQDTSGGATATSSDGVDSMQFYRALIPICERLDLHAPPLEVLKEILLAVKRVTFFGFLMALAKSEALNSSIGKLPPKSELLDVSEQENASPPLRPTSAKNRPRSAQSRPLSAGGTTTQSSAEVSVSTEAKSVRASKSQPTTTATTSVTAVTSTTAVSSTVSAPTSTAASLNVTQKAQTPRGKPAPRRARRPVVISDDDDSESDNDDDDSGSTTN